MRHATMESSRSTIKQKRQSELKHEGFGLILVSEKLRTQQVKLMLG